MKLLQARIASLLLLVLFSASAYAQSNALVVNVQGTVFDRSEPPGPTKTITESLGAKVILAPDSSQTGFNMILFTENVASPLFRAFHYPGNAADAADSHVPGNAFPFYGTVQDGRVVGDLVVYSGHVQTVDGRSYLYSSSLDNPMGEFNPWPVYSWDYVNDGVVGNGDNLACEPAKGPLPKPDFIVVVERGKCLFWEKAVNAAAAGATAIVIFNHEDGGDQFVTMRTPGANIPAAFLRRTDGLELLSYVNGILGAPLVAITPTNLMGTVVGTYTLDGTGAVSGVNISLYMSDANNSIFAGTISR